MKKLFYAVAALIAASLIAHAETRSPKGDIKANLAIFNAVVKEVQSNYVDSIDMEDVVETAIAAMLNKFDPYTEYMPRKVQEDFKVLNSGEYGGIGSYIMQRDGNVYISGPHKGSPADKAGLRSGDLIMSVDTVTVLGMTSDKVSERLKGPRGTTVKVKVKRPYVGADSILTFDIVREKIQIPAVSYSGMLPGEIGYIQLSQFSEKSAEEVEDALKSMLATCKLKGLVLDLRDNGGGFLESAVKILGYFLPKGTEVLRTRGKGVMDERVYKTAGKPIAPDLPLVVLIDDGTASASEITSGALQDLDRAVIMGSRSFGKGLVQTTRSIPYDGLLKVTVARYYIPSGRLIQAIDYSHRNPDGTVARIPDSLTNVFTTAAGREVRDGGGITPDVKVTYPDITRVTYNAVRDNWVFDYANRYRATHDHIAPAAEFVVDDSIYADFKRFIDPAKFNHDNVGKAILDRLSEVATVEGYMSDSLKNQIAVVEGMLQRPLDQDLDANRKAIVPYLEREIANRYYYREGEAQSFLRHDVAIDSALSLLKDSDRYKALLAPKSRKSTKK